MTDPSKQPDGKTPSREHLLSVNGTLWSRVHSLEFKLLEQVRARKRDEKRFAKQLVRIAKLIAADQRYQAHSPQDIQRLLVQTQAKMHGASAKTSKAMAGGDGDGEGDDGERRSGETTDEYLDYIEMAAGGGGCGGGGVENGGKRKVEEGRKRGEKATGAGAAGGKDGGNGAGGKVKGSNKATSEVKKLSKRRGEDTESASDFDEV